jgi:hypothetical protein
MESGFCACIVSTPCLAFRRFTRMELATFRIMAGKFLQTCVFKIAPKKTRLKQKCPKQKIHKTTKKTIEKMQKDAIGNGGNMEIRKD